MGAKRCPTCGRTYIDETLSFCLEDGAPLVYDDSVSEPVTAVFPGTVASAPDAPTRTFDDSARPAATAALNGDTVSQSSRPAWMRYVLPALAVFILAAGGLWAYSYFSGRGGRQIVSIAVMPFANASGNPDLEYLSDGITESLINSLTRVPDLSVKARSSVFTYKGKEVSPQQVAKELSVEAVLNGRVVQRGDAVTLNLELVEAATGNQLWGEQYNRKLADLTALQSEIARDVSAKLHTKLTGTDEQRVAKNYTQNAEAYQLYLKGKYHWNRRSREDILKSIDYFRQAVDKDPNYALAYSGLAEAYILLPTYANQDPQVAYTSARTAGARALELDSTLAEAHAALGVVLSEYDWNFAEAERNFRRAIELNPNYATAHHWYAEFLMAMGRFPEALAEIRRAQELDPLSLIINGIHGLVLGLNGQHDEAFAQLRRTLEMDPNFTRTHIFLAEMYQDVGRYEEAANELHMVSVLSGMPESQVAKAHKQVLDAYRREGPKGYFRMMAGFLEERRKAQEAGNPPPAAVVAANWLRAGDKENAYRLLEEGLRRRDPTMLRLRNPVFDPIKGEERYQAIVKQVGLPE